MKNDTMQNEHRIHGVALQEPMYMTWGRIMTRIMYCSDDQRLKDLAQEFNKKMQSAKVEEDFYKLNEII